MKLKEIIGHGGKHFVFVEDITDPQCFECSVYRMVDSEKDCEQFTYFNVFDGDEYNDWNNEPSIINKEIKLLIL